MKWPGSGRFDDRRQFLHHEILYKKYFTTTRKVSEAAYIGSIYGIANGPTPGIYCICDNYVRRLDRCCRCQIKHFYSNYVFGQAAKSIEYRFIECWLGQNTQVYIKMW
jgi:hypothetical protein